MSAPTYMCQHLCESGHRYDHDDRMAACPHCGAECKRCDLGHTHIVKPAVCRIPTPEEGERLVARSEYLLRAYDLLSQAIGAVTAAEAVSDDADRLPDVLAGLCPALRALAWATGR